MQMEVLYFASLPVSVSFVADLLYPLSFLDSSHAGNV